MPGSISYQRPLRGGVGIRITEQSPDQVSEIALDGGLGAGVILLYPPADTIAAGGPGTFENLFLVPGGVTLTEESDVLLNFSASVQVTPPPAAVISQGVAFQFLWDGAPLTSNRFFQLDTAAAGVFDTFALNVELEDLITGQLAGNHTLAVQWLAVDPLSDVAFFGAGTGSLKIQAAL
jgi:hypothetical protein